MTSKLHHLLLWGNALCAHRRPHNQIYEGPDYFNFTSTCLVYAAVFPSWIMHQWSATDI